MFSKIILYYTTFSFFSHSDFSCISSYFCCYSRSKSDCLLDTFSGFLCVQSKIINLVVETDPKSQQNFEKQDNRKVVKGDGVVLNLRPKYNYEIVKHYD